MSDLILPGTRLCVEDDYAQGLLVAGESVGGAFSTTSGFKLPDTFSYGISRAGMYSYRPSDLDQQGRVFVSPVEYREATVMAVVSANSASATAGEVFTLRLLSGGSNVFKIGIGNGVTQVPFVEGLGFSKIESGTAIGDVAVLVAQYKVNELQRLYLDGVLVCDGTDTSGQYTYSGGSLLQGYSTATPWLAGGVNRFAVWNRLLSYKDIATLSLDSKKLFRAKSRPVYFSAATGGIAPTTGSYAHTGNTPTISQPRTAAPSSGAYTVAGNTPSISQPRTLAPATGAYAYLGNTPEVSQIAGIRPTTGSYVYTGSTPTISQPRTIAPLEGGYAYAGNTPTVIQSAGVSLSPEDLAAIADAVWSSAEAVAAHAKLDAILARLTC